jgi:hypothetical protein
MSPESHRLAIQRRRQRTTAGAHCAYVAGCFPSDFHVAPGWSRHVPVAFSAFFRKLLITEETFAIVPCIMA